MTRTRTSQDELSAYFRIIASSSRINAEEEHTLALAWRDHGCTASREQLITANLRLVVMIAKRYMGRGTPLDEIVAEGNVGLIHAVDNFDPRAGTRFSTYAVYWVRHSIAEVFARASSRARLTRAERADVAALERAAAAFLATHGRAATNTELCNELCWHPEKGRAVQALASGRSRPRSLSEDAPAALALASTDDPIGGADESGAGGEKLRAVLDLLSDEERRVVEMRFGLNGTEPAAIGAIAKATGAAPRVVRMRLETAMRKLTRHAASERDRANLDVASVA